MALIGKVVAMTGVAFVITGNGSKRELKLGDQVQTSDSIQTPRGVDVDLELVTGRVIHIQAEQLVAFTDDLTETIVPSGLDSAINLATIDTVIKAIESGKDINDVLEETAAGPDGVGNIHGFGFVDLLRINDDLNNFKFNFEYETDGRPTNEPFPALDDNVNTAQFALGDAAPVYSAEFTDNFVNGLSYTTSSGLSGLTGDAGVAGQFKYRAGDTITFNVGGVVVAEFNANVIHGDILFIQDIVGTALSNTNHMYVENMAIFLQALDSDLQDSTPADGVLHTNHLVGTAGSYASNINITQATRDAFAGYHLNLATSDKPQVSSALAHVGIEFTAATEIAANGQNVFETIAMQHVATTIHDLAGARAPAKS